MIRRCSDCGGDIKVPVDDDDDLCGTCHRKENRRLASSSAVPDGFWDRTARKD